MTKAGGRLSQSFGPVALSSHCLVCSSVQPGTALKDAGTYVTRPPKAEHDAPEWQTAMEALILLIWLKIHPQLGKTRHWVSAAAFSDSANRCPLPGGGGALHRVQHAVQLCRQSRQGHSNMECNQ